MQVLCAVKKFFLIFLASMVFDSYVLAMESTEEKVISPRLLGCLHADKITVDFSSEAGIKKLMWISKELTEFDFPNAILRIKAEHVNSNNLKALLSLLNHAHYLDLSDNGLNETDAKIIAESDNLKNLKKLDLSGNKIGSIGAIAIATSKKFRLQELNLQENQILINAVYVIANSKRFGLLTLLDLSGNPIHDAGAKAIADSTTLKKLKKLNLSATGMSDEGVLTILFTKHRENLEEFYGLMGNPKITPDIANMAKKFFASCDWTPKEISAASRGKN